MKRRVLTLVIACGLTLSSASTAFGVQPTTPRQDQYFQTVCTLRGIQFSAERVDARAVTLGGKATAVQNFNQNNPIGLVCELVGPFSP